VNKLLFCIKNLRKRCWTHFNSPCVLQAIWKARSGSNIGKRKEGLGLKFMYSCLLHRAFLSCSKNIEMQTRCLQKIPKNIKFLYKTYLAYSPAPVHGSSHRCLCCLKTMHEKIYMIAVYLKSPCWFFYNYLTYNCFIPGTRTVVLAADSGSAVEFLVAATNLTLKKLMPRSVQA
jgi:hypothetical protein